MLQQLRRTGEELVFETMGRVKRRGQETRLQAALAAAREQGREIKISIGGGQVDLPGWISTDIVWWARHYLDVTKDWPVPSGTVDAIYGDNMIEHLTVPDARVALRRMRDALRPGGVLRLATPDLEATAKAYLNDGDLAARHLDRHRRHGYEVYHRADLLRLTFVLHGHHEGYIYDEAALRAEIERAGFTDVVRCCAGESSVAMMKGLERRHEPSESETELILEATK
jgi:predicted SAM-dependent methyltransferase